MDRRRFLISSGATLAATTVPALSAGAQQAGSSSRAPVEIKMSIWMTGAEATAFKTVLKHFETLYPAIKVTIVDVSGPNWGRQKLETLIAGGNPPDVMQLNDGQFQAFAARGALLNLDSYYKRDKIDLSQYTTGAIPGCKFNGTFYATPRFLSVHAMYYNKDLFRKAGVPFPTKDWTWPEFTAIAKKLTNPSKHVWGYGLINDVWQWGAMVYANGGTILSADHKQCLMDNPRTIEALDWFFGLQFRDKVVPPAGSLPPAQNWSGAQFTAQSVAMAILGPWFRPSMVTVTPPFDWDVITTPLSPRTHKTASTIYVDQFAGGASTAHPEETWQLLKWLGSQDFHTQWINTFGASSVDALTTIVKSPKWMNYGKHSGQPFIEEAKVALQPPILFGNGGRVQDVWNAELQLLQLGQESAATAVQKIKAKLQPILAQST